MDEMLDKAIEKLQTEANKKLSDRTIQNVCEYLIDYVQAHPETASKIMTAGKTIAGSINAMRDAARKMVHGSGAAVISDADGYKIIRNYFGITGGDDQDDARPAITVVKSASAADPAVPAAELNVSVEDLLVSLTQPPKSEA